MDESDVIDFAATSTRGPLRNFVAEFLGGLIPGVAFLLGLLPALILPTAAAADWSLLRTKDPALPSSLLPILFVVIPAGLAFLVVAYIAGHLFYRQDPKKPDQASFRRTRLRDGDLTGVSRPTDGKIEEVEFPYRHLKLYLLDRGLEYLANLVPWDDQAGFDRRAKHFANALKIRTSHSAPRQYGLLAKNEGHVRLSSSMWYVCRLLFWASVAGFVIAFFLAALSSDLRVAAKTYLIFPLSIAWLSALTKFGIEKSLHYQRQREILFILESAYWLQKSGSVPGIFSGLEPSPTSDTAHSPA